MNFETISSIKDPRIQQARELTTLRGRKEAHKCLAEGADAVQWALDAQVSLEHVFVIDTAVNEALVQTLTLKGIPCYIISEGIAKKITETSYVVPYIGVVSVLPEMPIQSMGDFVIVLDHIQDYGNLGTILRTATAFGVKDIVFTHEGTDMFFKKSISASRGTVFRTRTHSFQDGAAALHALKSKYQVIATSPRGTALQSLVPLQGKPIALVLGNETEGISQEIFDNADYVVQMPMSSAIESLNVGVFAGLSIYELKLRMIMAMLIHYIHKLLGRQVNVAGKLIRSVFDTELSKISNLTAMQVVLLMIMKSDGLMSLEQIGKDTGYYGADLDLFLLPLLEQRLLQRVEGSFSLTSQGEELLVKLWPVVELTQEKILQNFSEAEKTALFDYLERIQHNCTTLLKSDHI